MCWPTNGHLKDISDIFRTFMGHSSVPDNATGKLQCWYGAKEEQRNMCLGNLAIDWRLLGDFGEYLAIAPYAKKEWA